MFLRNELFLITRFSCICRTTSQKSADIIEDPKADHFDSGFLGFFLCLQTNTETPSEFQVTSSCFSCSPHYLVSLNYYTF